jgi:hypothetical protein
MQSQLRLAGLITGMIAANNCYSLSTQAYIADFSGNNIQQCAVSNDDGSLQKCKVVASSNIFNNPSGVAIYQNSLYINNSALDKSSPISSSYLRCTLNYRQEPTGCKLNYIDELNGPMGISFYNDNAYIANFNSGTYTRCKANSDGLSQCNTQLIPNLPDAGTPEAFAFHNGFAYITDQKNDGYMVCRLTPSGLLANDCQFSPLSRDGVLKAVGPRGMLVDKNYIYFVNSGYHGPEKVTGAISSYTQCTISENGLLSNCTTMTLAATELLNSPTAIVKHGDYVYITNEQGPGYNYTKCSIEFTSGQLTNCVNATTGGAADTPTPAYTHLVFSD